MAELVECGLNLVYGEQCNAVLVRRSEVCNIADDGTHLVAVSIEVLVAEIVHPRAASLAGTGEIVAGEYSKQVSVLIGHFVDNYLRIVFRNVWKFFYIYSVEGLCGQEDTLAHVVDLEVRLGHLLVQGVFLLADFL